MNIEEIIKSSPELSSLMENLPLIIMNRLFYKKYKANTVIFYKGDMLDYIYLLFNGEVQISNMFNNGCIFVIHKDNNVSFIGEQTVLAGENIASVTVTAIKDSEFILIRKDDFLRWLELDHKFALYQLKNLAKRNYYNSLELGSKSYYSKQMLLERYLCSQFEKESSSKVIINIKRQEMADSIGTSLRSLERGIASLKNEQLITIEKRKITVNQLQYNRMVEKMNE
ncbi:MAG: Crp/Fnr family transcriptional regulator [Pleomorphochaeta sp.]